MKLDPLGVKRAAQIGAAVFGFVAEPFRRLRQRRRRKRNARLMASWIDEHGGPPDEVLEIFNEGVTQEATVLQGKLTYSGVAALGLAWLAERFGVPVAGGEVETVVTALLALYGVAAGVYGRWRATQG